MSLQKRQQRGFGSMMSFELGSLEKANAFVSRLKLCYFAESLGWRGDAGVPSGDDDACCAWRGGQGEAWDHRWTDSHLCRNRGRRGHHRGSGAGAELVELVNRNKAATARVVAAFLLHCETCAAMFAELCCSSQQVTTCESTWSSRCRLLLPAPRITTAIFTTVRSASTFTEAKTSSERSCERGFTKTVAMRGNSERVFGAGGT